MWLTNDLAVPRRLQELIHGRYLDNILDLIDSAAIWQTHECVVPSPLEQELRFIIHNQLADAGTTHEWLRETVHPTGNGMRYRTAAGRY